MGFDPLTKFKAFERAGGQCECCRKNCGHIERCMKQCRVSNDVIFFARLRNDYSLIHYPGFEFHHKLAEASEGPNTLDNCEFLCEECHKNTASYGRPKK